MILPVSVTRDWVDWLLFAVQLLSLIGTGAAALLAFLTIRQAKAQALESQDALVRERRLDFELDVLRDLVLAVSRGDHLNLRGLAVLLPADDIPLIRVMVGLQSTPEAELKLAKVKIPPGAHPTSYIGALKDDLFDELIRATQARIRARPDVAAVGDKQQTMVA